MCIRLGLTLVNGENYWYSPFHLYKMGMLMTAICYSQWTCVRITVVRAVKVCKGWVPSVFPFMRVQKWSLLFFQVIWQENSMTSTQNSILRDTKVCILSPVMYCSEKQNKTNIKLLLLFLFFLSFYIYT